MTKQHLRSFIWCGVSQQCHRALAWNDLTSFVQKFYLASKKCKLCLAKRFEIPNLPEPEKLLNKRSEITLKCWDQRRFKLALSDTDDWLHIKWINANAISWVIYLQILFVNWKIVWTRHEKFCSNITSLFIVIFFDRNK